MKDTIASIVAALLLTSSSVNARLRKSSSSSDSPCTESNPLVGFDMAKQANDIAGQILRLDPDYTRTNLATFPNVSIPYFDSRIVKTYPSVQTLLPAGGSGVLDGTIPGTSPDEHISPEELVYSINTVFAEMTCEEYGSAHLYDNVRNDNLRYPHVDT